MQPGGAAVGSQPGLPGGQRLEEASITVRIPACARMTSVLMVVGYPVDLGDL